jgi:hypothetical protein
MLLKNIAFLIRLLVYLLQAILGKNKQELTYKIKEETEMGLVYEVTLPSIGAPDVKGRVLTCSINGVSKDINLLSVENLVTLPVVKQGDSIVLIFKEIDDVGNVSEPSDPVSFIATDTIAPPKPGLFSVKLVQEIADPEVVAPVVEPPVENVEPVNVVEAEAIVSPPKTEITLED